MIEASQYDEGSGETGHPPIHWTIDSVPNQSVARPQQTDKSYCQQPSLNTAEKQCGDSRVPEQEYSDIGRPGMSYCRSL